MCAFLCIFNVANEPSAREPSAGILRVEALPASLFALLQRIHDMATRNDWLGASKTKLIGKVFPLHDAVRSCFKLKRLC